MAKQSYDYNQIFGFDKIDEAIRKLDAQFIQLQQSGVVWLDRIEAKEKDVLDVTRKLINALKNIGLDDAKITAKFQGIDEEVDKAGKKLAQLQEIAKGLTGTIDANEVSISNLKGAVKLLNSEYEKLDPKSETFKQDQKQIAEGVSKAKAAIAGQTAALKGLNISLSATDKSYVSLTQETNALWKQLKSLDNAFDLNTGALNKNNKAAVETYNQIVKNRQVLKDIDAQLGSHTRNVGNYGSGWQSAKGDLLAFAGVTTVVDTALRAITKTFEVLSTFDRYRSVIQFASKDTAEFKSNLDFLNTIADKTGTEIEILYAQYGRFAVVGREANFSVKQTRDLFASIVKTGGALKMSNEGIELSLKAVEQMMSKGKISAEELRQQLGDHLPGAMQLFSKALGVSVEKLGEMMKNGEVLSADTLPKFAERLEKTFGKESQNNVNTINGSFNRMTNNLKLIIDQFGQDAGVQKFFSAIQNGIADTLAGIRQMVKDNAFLTFLKFTNPATFAAGLIEAKNTELKPDKVDRNNLSGFSGLSRKDRETNIFRLSEANNSNKKRLEKMTIGSADYMKLKDAVDKEGQLIAQMAKVDAKLTAEENKRAKENAKKPKPEKEKRELTELEKHIKSITDSSAKLMDNALGDVKRGESIKLPEKDVQEWYRLYDILDGVARQFGVEIPSGIEKTKRDLDRILGKDVLSKLGNMEAMGNGYIYRVPEQLKGIKPNNTAKLPKVDDFFNFSLRQETERFDLQRQLSGRLRNLKEEEKTKLLGILAEMQKAERDGDDEKRKRLKEQFDFTIGLAKDEAAERKRLQQSYLQAVVDVAQSGAQLAMSIQEHKITQLEKQRDYELKMVGDNEAAKANITERFARQITEIRRKQAIAEKAMAVFQIGINTASAIIRMLADPGGVAGVTLSVLAGIAGGIQAAAVLAKPIPAFAIGTDSAPEGPALIAEKGAELRESRGKYWLYDKPTIANLNQGDKIYTAAETTAMLAQNAIRQEELNRLGQNRVLNQQTAEKLNRAIIVNNTDRKSIADGMSDGWQKVKDDIIIHQTSFDENGVNRWIKTKNAQIEYQQKRYNLG